MLLLLCPNATHFLYQQHAHHSLAHFKIIWTKFGKYLLYALAHALWAIGWIYIKLYEKSWLDCCSNVAHCLINTNTTYTHTHKHIYKYKKSLFVELVGGRQVCTMYFVCVFGGNDGWWWRWWSLCERRQQPSSLSLLLLLMPSPLLSSLAVKTKRNMASENEMERWRLADREREHQHHLTFRRLNAFRQFYEARKMQCSMYANKHACLSEWVNHMMPNNNSLFNVSRFHSLHPLHSHSYLVERPKLPPNHFFFALLCNHLCFVWKAITKSFYQFWMRQLPIHAVRITPPPRQAKK